MNINVNEVILVDEKDVEIGTMDKLTAHQEGKLHRAFSIFVFNSEGKLLLQRRALDKYHSGGLWTNTCCSHPAPGESLNVATMRRLPEEMGFQCEVQHAFQFIYKAELDHHLIEHELDHVFIGQSDLVPVPNPEEVMEFQYMGLEHIEQSLQERPDEFTAWFKICYKPAYDFYLNKKRGE